MVKTHRIRIYPSDAQKQLILQRMGQQRRTYNTIVSAINADTGEPGTGRNITLQEIRTQWIHVAARVNVPWAKTAPYELLDEAAIDVCKARDSNEAKIKKQKGTAGGLTHYKLGFRTLKHMTRECIGIAPRMYGGNKQSDWYQLFGRGVPMRSAEPLPWALRSAAKLTRNRLGHYHLCVVIPVEMHNGITRGGETQAPVNVMPSATRLRSVISLDPGLRSFMTGYDADGGIVEWGAGDIWRAYRLCVHYDQLRARYSRPEVPHARRWRMRRAALRLQLRIRRLVDDVHHRLARWLCENYRVVLLPEFRTSEMVMRWDERKRKSRKRRLINSKTARAMLTWGHFRFRQHLIHKVREFPSCRVIICDEVYTSKTCGRCGSIHGDLGTNKVFECPAMGCGFVADRDAAAARNILMRYLTRQGIRPGACTI